MTMITSTAIKSALQTWVVAAVASLDDAHVVFAEQAAPQPPSSPYATIKIVGPIQSIGQEHEYGWGTDPGQPDYVPQKLAGDRRVTASVQIFGTGALDLAREAAQSLGMQSVRDTFALSGLAPVAGIPDVLDLTELLDTSWEERGQFDCEFFFGDTYTDDVPVIETVSGTETLQDAAGNDIRTINYDTSQGA